MNDYQIEDVTPHIGGKLCACTGCRNGKGTSIMLQELADGYIDDVEYHLYSYPNPFGGEIFYKYERV